MHPANSRNPIQQLAAQPRQPRTSPRLAALGGAKNLDFTVNSVISTRPVRDAGMCSASVTPTKRTTPLTQDQKPTPGAAGGQPEPAGFRMPDPSLLGRTMTDVAERSGRIVQDWLRRQSEDGTITDQMHIGRAFMDMTSRLMTNPARLVQAQLGFWQDYLTLWQNTARRMMGVDP